MLYLIGLGLMDEKSISVYGLEAVKKCKKVYFENYTSKLECRIKDLEKFYGKKIIKVERKFVEEDFDVNEAKNENVALLIIGDVFSATTHINLYNDCRSKNVKVEIINNASVLTAIGVSGLSLYNFGKVASIPFHNENVKSPIDVLNENKKINAHTLFLLDLDPSKNKYLSIKDGIEYLERNNINEKIIGCARLGSRDFIIKYGDMEKIKEINFNEGPYCLIITSKKLHFVEEGVLEKWKI